MGNEWRRSHPQTLIIHKLGCLSRVLGASEIHSERRKKNSTHPWTVNREQENNGIVQKFEEPTSPYNTLIRAYWTPHKVFIRGGACFSDVLEL